MRTWFIIGAVILTSCSASQNAVRHSPAVPMADYATVTIAKVVSPDAGIGERVAARLAVRFSTNGYSVTSLEKLKNIAGKNILTSAKLTPEEKAVLKTSGIKAVVYGTIERYDCKSFKEWTWTGFAPEKTDTELCQASLSVKIIDAATGDILWQAQEAYSKKDPNMTARMVLERVLVKIEDEIPQINR